MTSQPVRPEPRTPGSEANAELEDVHRSLALLSRHLLPTDGPPLVVLNAFSMGAWATGTNVAVALRAIGVVKSCGPDIDKVLGTIRLLGAEPTYVVCGYPPFLRILIDAAAARGQDLSKVTMYAFVGGKGITEAARRRLERTFTGYGRPMAHRTSISAWPPRRRCQCGCVSVLPSVRS